MQRIIKSTKKIIRKKFSKQYSVVFIRQSYYHFFYLAKALKARGWNTLCVNFESPDSPNSLYYHGEDINVYNDDPLQMQQNVDQLFKLIAENYHLIHFAGDGLLSLYDQYVTMDNPTDLQHLKDLGKKILYTISGCNSGTGQSSVRQWSALDGSVVCDKCKWQNDPIVCNDEKNLAWGKKVTDNCDLIFAETLPALDYMRPSAKVIRDPVTLCLDDSFWSPGLKIPAEYLLVRKSDEILIYHAVGNFELRSNNTDNIKGTGAVMNAIDKLKAAGYPVRLIFVTNMKNTEVRFYQAQADIIIDQLNYGRYGATAREGMMLGKPVICYIQTKEINKNDEMDLLKNVPLYSASEETVYDALKFLLDNPEERRRLGERARQYALEWHSPAKCAERYEKIYEEKILKIK